MQLKPDKVNPVTLTVVEDSVSGSLMQLLVSGVTVLNVLIRLHAVIVRQQGN